MLDDATLGPFVLQEEIGRGGMARVFSAYHQNDGTPVAVKLMLPGLDGTSEAEPPPEPDLGTMQVVFEEAKPESDFAQAFGYEVQAAAQLDHPCVTTVYDHGFVTADEERGRELPEGAPWLAMELVSGGTLADDIAARRWPELRQIVLDVLDGLAHAHARGLIHRDVKPGNVLVDALTERVKLADFGLAHSIQGEREGALADTSNIIGTPAYMAPEQIEARWQDYGPWTDLYAVGVMAWTLSTGRPPYQGSVTMVLQGHLEGALPTFETAHPMPEGFLGWVKGMMHPLSTGRFRRAADAAWALTQLGEVEDETAGSVQASASAPQLQSLVMNPAGPTMAMPRAATLEALQAEGLTTALFGHALVRAPIPVSWRAPRQPRRHLHGAGLALFEHRSTGLVGRVAERDRLWQALQTVTLDGRLSAILLDGPSGSGKSTLARWLTERSDEVGAAQHLEVSHSASDGAADGLGPMLSRHFRIQELKRTEAVARVAERLSQLGIEDREEAVALTELARPSTDEEHAEAGLSVRFGGPRERHVLLSRYLGHLASIRPVVLWVDDLVHGPD
ncbi:MAG: serine/threonine-protein kinase, partial [Myxococcota bacterium]|nr:serine/threonine-protein kinase [Myxococcota bacterium]